MIVLKIVSIVYSEAVNVPAFLLNLAFWIGMYKIFAKSGVDPRYAFVPCYREYQMAKVGDCEEEGKVLFYARFISIILTLVLFFSHHRTSVIIFCDIIHFTLMIILWFYSLRVYLGLVEIFDEKKKWMLLWIFFPWFVSLYWGFSDKYDSRYDVPDIEREKEILLSNSNLEVLADGLTVNLEERKAQSLLESKVLLRDVHMSIKPGQMVLLLGGSGAGKTTLINAMIGYEKANAQIVLDGTNVYKNYKKMQYEIGFVPQQDLMREDDTVYHTLMDAATLRMIKGYNKKDRKKRVKEVMALFGLESVSDSLVEKLSGGQKKRLSIAMEFIPNPKLFVLDEPDSGLDGVMARELMEQLHEIAKQGKIVIVITHTPDRVADLFDQVIVLAKDSDRTGRLAYYGPIADAKAFFESESMENIVMKINQIDEGGEGRADEFVMKYVEEQNARQYCSAQ